jgi:1,2-dihydroxy-3-keto-5-methylthiopentene dioxygenase
VIRAASEIAATLAKHGVRFERWRTDGERQLESMAVAALPDAQIVQAYAREIERARTAHGYRSQDVVRMQRGPEERDEQAYQQRVQTARSKFLAEHVHAEDEVRCFAQGSGLFSLRLSEHVFQVFCEAGDMLSVPAGTRHWFDMGSVPSFCALRLFGSPEGWVARYTGDAIAQAYPSYDEVALRWR